MTGFRDARLVVERELGPTLKDGFEDVSDYNVLLVQPEPDDQVNLVDKATGEMHREVAFEQWDRLAQMWPVSDLESDLP